VEGKKKKVLLIYQNYSTFVKEDFEILSSSFDVTKYYFKSSKNPFIFLFEFVKLFCYSIFQIPRHNIVYSWFADYHSFIPTLFGRIFLKRTVVIVGGYDAVSIPSIEFGVFYKNNFRTFCTRFTLGYADFIFPVDESLVESVNYYADPDKKGYSVGIKYFVRRIRGKIVVIPTGYDHGKWKRKNGINPTNTVITIGGAPDLKTFLRKGIDLVIETANIMPSLQFYIVGLSGRMEKFAKSKSGNNVNFLGYIPNDKLPEILSSHNVFLQLSLSEGLPNSLCEAMLCECIPVGTDVNGIPKCIGDTGFILKEKNAEKAADLINQALNASESAGKNVRKRVIGKFLKSKRRKKILDILNS
jgi:glycosyltransferase involved in cell wall biosynthesis